METRETIEQEVGRNPGISFTELKQKTGLPNGVLQYHIDKSDGIGRKKGAILSESTCEECDLKDRCYDKCLLKVLRKQENKDIIRMKIQGASYSEIGEQLGIDSSTVSYHVSKLKELGLFGESEVPPEVRDYLGV